MSKGWMQRSLLVMISILLAFMIVACGNNEAAPSEEDATQASSSATDEEAEAAKAEADAAKAAVAQAQAEAAAAKAAAEQAAADKVAAEQALADAKTEAEKVAAQKALDDATAEASKKAAEEVAAAKAAADKAAAEKTAAEAAAKAAAVKVAADKAAATKAAADAAAKELAKLTGTIRIDGSSTVYPISQAVAEEFMNKFPNVNVTVGLSGSSNGIKAIINAEADIANSSRLMKDTELQSVKDKGDEAIKMPVAYDGITVVIHPTNYWAKQMTVEELKKIWNKGSTIKKWSEIRPEWPDFPITLYGPGTASGTFEYFTEAINGKAKESRSDYTASEDDNVLVQGISGDKFALGYFGFSYYEENMSKLKAVSIKTTADAKAVAPTKETIGNGTYKPLSREIFIYPLKSKLAKPEVKEFIKFYMSKEGQALVEEVGYVHLGQSQYDQNLAQLPK